MTHTLQWPESRGQFRAREPDPTPADHDTLVVEPGDVITVEDDDVAEHYRDRGFQDADPEPDDDGDGGLEEADAEPEDPGGDADPDDGDAEAPADDQDEDAAEDAQDDPGEDADEADAEPMDWDDFQAMDYRDRVAAVEAGDVDHLLDRAADEDGSQNVQDAIQERQDAAGG